MNGLSLSHAWRQHGIPFDKYAKPHAHVACASRSFIGFHWRHARATCVMNEQRWFSLIARLIERICRIAAGMRQAP